MNKPKPPDSSCLKLAIKFAVESNKPALLALAGYDTCSNSFCSTLVPGDGAIPCKYMIIGEAPGEEEQKQLMPFVGRAGRLLDALIASISMKRDEFYITNIVKCKPPKNKKPSKAEARRCSEVFLWDEIKRVKPEEILLFGDTTIKTVLKTEEGIKTLHGQYKELSVENSPIKCWCFDHPAHALRSPKIKARMEEDWLRKWGKLSYNIPNTQTDLNGITNVSLISYDTEFRGNEFICGAISIREGFSIPLDSPFHAPQGSTIIMHNLRADIPYLYGHHRVEDTMLMAALLGEEQLSLRELCKKYLNTLIPSFEEVKKEDKLRAMAEAAVSPRAYDEAINVWKIYRGEEQDY